MSLTPVFTGYVDDTSKFIPADPDKFRQHREAMRGKLVEVVIRPQHSKRSLQQNKWLWGVALELIVIGYGYEKPDRKKAKEHLHYKLVTLCFGSTFDERLHEDVPNVRSSHLSTKQFSQYMEWLVRYAAQECNTIIPLPDDIDLDDVEDAD